MHPGSRSRAWARGQVSSRHARALTTGPRYLPPSCPGPNGARMLRRARRSGTVGETDHAAISAVPGSQSLLGRRQAGPSTKSALLRKRNERRTSPLPRPAALRPPPQPAPSSCSPVDSALRSSVPAGALRLRQVGGAASRLVTQRAVSHPGPSGDPCGGCWRWGMLGRDGGSCRQRAGHGSGPAGVWKRKLTGWGRSGSPGMPGGCDSLSGSKQA